MVSTPEFCFLQMASQLTLVQLIMLGYELCGTYSLPNQSELPVAAPGFYKRQPLTSKKKLSALLANMPNIAGHQKATRALQYIQDGSASPMETRLAILLCLPSKMGGYGFALPNFNVRIDLPIAAQREIGKAFLVCDLFWPETKVAVEYDSNLYHTGAKRIADDSKRRLYLRLTGIMITSVTNDQIISNAGIEAISAVLAIDMGRRTRPHNRIFLAAREELRRQLFTYSA